MEQANLYSVFYKKYGIDSRSLGWTKSSQIARFERILNILDFRNTKILDVGSGFSDLLFFLHSKGIKLELYEGLEIFPPFCTEANRRIDELLLKNHRVSNNSWQDLEIEKIYDVVVSIGVFNFKVRDNYSELMEFINKMRMTDCNSLIISVLSNRAPEVIRSSNHQNFFYDPDIVSEYLMRNNLSFEVFHDYLPHDFTIEIKK